jgi:hypothetical protein
MKVVFPVNQTISECAVKTPSGPGSVTTTWIGKGTDPDRSYYNLKINEHYGNVDFITGKTFFDILIV